MNPTQEAFGKVKALEEDGGLHEGGPCRGDLEASGVMVAARLPTWLRFEDHP